MAEAVIVGIQSRGLWYRTRAFFSTNLINIFAGGLFALLAIFLLYPIGAVLVKSLWGDEGFTLEFYQEFFTFRVYYESFT
jgi:ABC-type spermidine/putrescine transport system permease subunit II